MISWQLVVSRNPATAMLQTAFLSLTVAYSRYETVNSLMTSSFPFPDRFVQLWKGDFARARFNAFQTREALLVESSGGNGFTVGQSDAVEFSWNRLVFLVDKHNLDPAFLFLSLLSGL